MSFGAGRFEGLKVVASDGGVLFKGKPEIIVSFLSFLLCVEASFLLHALVDQIVFVQSLELQSAPTKSAAHPSCGVQVL